MVQIVTFSVDEKIYARIEEIVKATKRSRSSVYAELLEVGLGVWCDGTAKEAIHQMPDEIFTLQMERALKTPEIQAALFKLVLKNEAEKRGKK